MAEVSGRRETDYNDDSRSLSSSEEEFVLEGLEDDEKTSNASDDRTAHTRGPRILTTPTTPSTQGERPFTPSAQFRNSPHSQSPSLGQGDESPMRGHRTPSMMSLSSQESHVSSTSAFEIEKGKRTSMINAGRMRKRDCLVPGVTWFIGNCLALGTAYLTQTTKEYNLVEGGFGLTTQVNDPKTAQWTRWQSAMLETSASVARSSSSSPGTASADPDSEKNIAWRRLTLLYQIPDGEVVSGVGVQKAKAVEDKLRSLAGWKKLCGEAPEPVQTLCDGGDSLISASFGTLTEVSQEDLNRVIDLEALLLIYQEQSPQPLRRWLPRFDAGSRGKQGLRSTFAFALNRASVKGWQAFLKNEVEPALLEMGVLSVKFEDTKDFRAYMVADGAPDVQEREIVRAVDEEFVMLAIGPLGAFLAVYIMTRRLFVSMSAASLTASVPMILSVGLMAQRGASEENVEQEAQVQILVVCSWFVVSAGISDLCVACVQSLEGRTGSLRPLLPEFALLGMLAWERPLKRLRWLLREPTRYWAAAMRIVRFCCEVMMPTAGVGLMLLMLSAPDLEMVGQFGTHAGLGLLLAMPLTAFLVPPAVEAGDAMAEIIQVYQQNKDFDPSEAVQALMDNFLPLEFGARMQWEGEMRKKVHRTLRDLLRTRWLFPLTMLLIIGLVIASLAVEGPSKQAFSANTPQLWQEGHRLYDRAWLTKIFNSQGDPMDPLEDPLRLTRQCSLSAYDSLKCAWYKCTARVVDEDSAAATTQEQQSQCRCYAKQGVQTCSGGAAARLWGLDTKDAQQLLTTGVFWDWTEQRLQKTFAKTKTARPDKYLEVEVWQTGGRSLDLGFSSLAGAGSWESACTNIACFCGSQQCEMKDTPWDYMGALDYGTSEGGEQGSDTTWSNGSNVSNASVEPSTGNLQDGTVELKVVWGMKVSEEPVEQDPSDGLDFSASFELEDVWSQRQLLAFCEGLAPELIVLKRGCWPIEFRTWLLDNGARYPVAPDLFYSSLREFFQYKATSAPSNLLGDQGVDEPDGGFWLADDGRAKAVYFKFRVAEDTDGSGLPAMRSNWESYLSLRNRLTPRSLGEAWIAPMSGQVAEGELATSAIVEQNARSVAFFLIGFACLYVLVTTQSLGLAVATAILLVIAILALDLQYIRASQREVTVMEILALITCSAMITLALMRGAQIVSWSQEGPGKDPTAKSRKHQQLKKVGAMGVAVGLIKKAVDPEEEEKLNRVKRLTRFVMRSVSVFGKPSASAEMDQRNQRSPKDLTWLERKELIRELGILNGYGLFEGGVAKERMGRAARAACFGTPQIWASLISSVVCYTGMQLSRLTGIRRVGEGAIVGICIALLFNYFFLPVFTLKGLGPCRVKGRAYAVLYWWIRARMPRPQPETAPQGLLDTDLGSLGVAATKVLGGPFRWLGDRAAEGSEHGHGTARAANRLNALDTGGEDSLTINGLDVHGATAMPPYHVVMAVKDRLDCSG
eukprot:TRINITY_DN28334_c0_g1_i1.p1 TRINITY_DN28334_c0_g1~~TRINITY_DN28334_c0_g1_i1.p1  ORF type:complete len:1475 (+),score=274.30 TRINITY_DN28334_c0_g1_i1:69-4493(+)